MTTSGSAFNWNEEVDFQGETLCADQLDRAKYAEFLTNYLNSAGQRDSGYVINLNAEWGAGKTWFLKRWCEELEKNHPVAYIDAWKNDFSDDPLVTVVEGIISALEALDTSQTDLKDGFVEQVSNLWKNSRAALNRGGPALIKGILRAQAGIDTNDILEDAVAESIGDFLKDALGEQKAQVESLEQSRNIIREWINKVAPADGENSQQPMYVFIDELDRCRPTYAIELLETVKHLFEIKGIVFVIATNTDQLQHSIKAVYGEGFDANRYLYRFFNRSFTLKAPDMKSLILSLDSFQSMARKLQSTGDGAILIELDNLGEFFAGLSEAFGFDLRTTYQWLDQLDFIFSDSSNVDRYFWGAVALMVAMRLSDPDLYYQHFHIKRRESSHSEHLEILKRSFGRRVVKEHRAERFLKMQVTVDHLPKSQSSLEGIPEKYSGYVWMEEKLPGNWVEKIRNELSAQNMSTDHYESFWDEKAQENPALSDGFYVAINYYSQRGATFEGYVKLVDMASDLE